MNVSLVLCTHNRAESLRETLRSLAELRLPRDFRWELLVVDNSSSDDTRSVVEDARAALPCRYLFEARLGKSHALNVAVPQARGDVLAFTDDDVTFHPDWLASLWRAFERYDCVGIGGRIVPVWRERKPRWYSEGEPYGLMHGVIVTYDHGDAVREIEMVPFGANMAFRARVFAECGLFKTNLGPNGTVLMRGEDTEFGERVRARGGRILYVPDAIVYHPVEPRRTRKTYFQSWYYHFGRRDVRQIPVPDDAVRWFGVPRYVFRGLAEDALIWMTSVDPKRRFYHKLQCCRALGQIAEFRRGSPGAAPPRA